LAGSGTLLAQIRHELAGVTEARRWLPDRSAAGNGFAAGEDQYALLIPPALTRSRNPGCGGRPVTNPSVRVFLDEISAGAVAATLEIVASHRTRFGAASGGWKRRASHQSADTALCALVRRITHNGGRASELIAGPLATRAAQRRRTGCSV
jgi:hypothetical protein